MVRSEYLTLIIIHVVFVEFNVETFYQLLEFNRRDPDTYCPVHIINIDVQDNHEEATLGAFQICDLCEKVIMNIFVNLL